MFRADDKFLNLNYSGSIVLETLCSYVLMKIPNAKNATGYFDIAQRWWGEEMHVTERLTSNSVFLKAFFHQPQPQSLLNFFFF